MVYSKYNYITTGNSFNYLHIQENVDNKVLNKMWIIVTGEPYPLKIESAHEGKYPFTYVLRWEKPRTGGLPIKEYYFDLRRVSNFVFNL